MRAISPGMRAAGKAARIPPAALALAWCLCCGGCHDSAGASGGALEGPLEGDITLPAGAERADELRKMLLIIRRYGMRDRKVLEAMARVPRHKFVPEDQKRYAYRDGPLPIGYGQTISEPYIVAEMTRQLNLTADSKVLEVGTGSGYQAAVLAEITPHVWTIEIIKPLAESAAERLETLGYTSVKVRHGDGYYGWEEEAPFDAIIVTAAAGRIPPPLLSQLKAGGRMVIPVGAPFSVQTLILVEKAADGTLTSRELMGVRFVPLTREKSAEN